MKIEDVIGDLFDILSPYGVDPSFPEECSRFFEKIIEKFDDKDDCLDYIRANVGSWFRTLTKVPDWIQSEDWQFVNGEPMIFVGQINIEPYPRLFHDQAAFYLFWDAKTGLTEVVIQVS